MFSGTSQVEAQAVASAAWATLVPRLDALAPGDIGLGHKCTKDPTYYRTAGKHGATNENCSMAVTSCGDEESSRVQLQGCQGFAQRLGISDKEAETEQQQQQGTPRNACESPSIHDSQQGKRAMRHNSRVNEEEKAQLYRGQTGMAISLLEVGTYNEKHSTFVPHSKAGSAPGQGATQNVKVLLHQPLGTQRERKPGGGSTEGAEMRETSQRQSGVEWLGDEHASVLVVVCGPIRSACEELKHR